MPETTVAGLRTYYEDTGSGPALVLVHGASTSSVWFEDLIPHLTDHFRVIAPDLRGWGKSERISEMPPTAWNDDLLALVDQLGVEQFHLAGTSLGARIALRSALDLPDRALSVTIDAVVLFDRPEGTAAIEAFFGGELPPELAQRIEYANGPDWREVMDTYLNVRKTPGLQEHYDFRGKLEALCVPALVCRGDVDDNIHSLAHSLKAHTEIPDSRLWVEPDTPFSALRFAPTAATGHIRTLAAAR